MENIDTEVFDKIIGYYETQMGNPNVWVSGEEGKNIKEVLQLKSI